MKGCNLHHVLRARTFPEPAGPITNCAYLIAAYRETGSKPAEYTANSKQVHEI